MNAAVIMGQIGFAGAAVCIASYLWGFVYKVKGFRPLAVLSLFSTVVALAELAIMLTENGGTLNAVYAMAFLVISGLAQALQAVKTRPDRQARGVRTRAGDDEDDA
jgi:hypothetical protein